MSETNKPSMLVAVGSAALLLAGLILTYCARNAQPVPVPIKPAAAPTIEAAAPEVLDEQYLVRLMGACGSSLTEVMQKVRAGQLLTVGNEVFPNVEHRRWFYYMVCMESRFNQAARSPVGATGLTQVMPKFAQEFADRCNLGKLGPKDLEDSQVNLLVGACQFRHLMDYYEGDPTLALAAYNSGKDSPTVKKTKVGDVRTGAAETQGYLAAAFVLDERMRKQK